ncbi:hypothetical protein GSI_00686 [Ganoderma sinense ZZ0214-1]|uniref:Uncharacterized protein n=1 Tax=Ganoderma sinense ZZ0214-1 TaxID=1077348 RepID=A0A2G8STB1_9APHY|nr:hypothetical protein GSI_00686 [Ganoderma sinense ZZ0214-1]
MKEIGSILLHPGGLATTGQGTELRLELRDTRYPSPKLEEDLRDCQLLVTRTPDGSSLQFNPKWGRPALDDWFRLLFPQAVAYMDEKYGIRNNRNNSGSHWELLRRKHSTLCLVRDRNLNGESLDEFKGSEVRQKSKYRICLVTQHAIPRSVYMTWRTLDFTASASELDNTDLFIKSDDEAGSGAERCATENILSSDEEVSRKGKGKAPAVQRQRILSGKKRTYARVIESDPESISDSESLFDDTHRNKRLKTMNVESDIEEFSEDEDFQAARYLSLQETSTALGDQSSTSHAGPSGTSAIDFPSSDHEMTPPPGNQLVLQLGRGNAVTDAPGTLPGDDHVMADGTMASRLGSFRYSVNPPWGTQYLEQAAKGLRTPGRPERNIWEDIDINVSAEFYGYSQAIISPCQGPRRISDEDASRPEQLVPIRLEFDVEHHKMRDTFVWNLNNPIITPEIFVQSVVDDYSFAPSYYAVITKAIQEQLSDYKAHSATFGKDGVMIDGSEDITNGKFSDEDAMWWEAWRKRVHSEVLYRLPNQPDPRNHKRRKVVKDETVEQLNGTAGDVPMTVDDFEEDENLMHEEMRILVKLDIIVGSYKLEDQFKWDLENIDPTPEQFAEIYCTDLGLGGEFRTSIAHSIREQVQIYQKSLFLVGHPSDGSAVQDDDLRMSLLPSLTSGARSMEQVSMFTPQLNYLSESELEKNEKDREKELARRKRKTTHRRCGVALPDREPPKTYRTPAIGFPEISPAALALAATAAAPTSHRAAAAAASLTIVNMVASETRDDRDPTRLILPQTPIAPIVPTPAPVPTFSKEKKVKGLFKPPSYPSSVLCPRANVKAPTPSTAADVSNLPPPLKNNLPAPSSSGIDRQGSKVVLTAKRIKELELEREVKEKEYADVQHANMIDGV